MGVAFVKEIFVRYKTAEGLGVAAWCKLLRDALLVTAKFPYSTAVRLFRQMALNARLEDEEDEGTETYITFAMFECALRKLARHRAKSNVLDDTKVPRPSFVMRGRRCDAASIVCSGVAVHSCNCAAGG